MAANVIKDRVLVTTTITGTGTYTLGAAISSGYQGFTVAAGFVSGDRVCYFVTDNPANPTAFECGEGTLTIGGSTTLTRATIRASSNSGSAVNWAAGTKYVACFPSSFLLVLRDSLGALLNETLTNPTINGGELNDVEINGAASGSLFGIGPGQIRPNWCRSSYPL